MAWTAPATATVGQILTAAFMNAQLRDNLLQTAPALVTTDGDMVVATAANTLKRLAAFSGDFLLHELGAWEISIAALTTNDAVGGASAGVAEIKVPVTQAEAEAGTNTRFSLWSSERVQQAIAALAGTLMAEEGSGTTVTVTWNVAFGSTPVVAGACVGVSGASSTEVFNLITARSTTGATGRPTDVDGVNRSETAMFIAMLT